MLVDYGANVDILDKFQMTPLQLAIVFEPSWEFPATKLLLHLGADVRRRTQFGDTATMLASKRGNLSLVRLLVGAGEDVEATNFDKSTCLHYAADYGHVQLFTWLIHRGLQPHAKNSIGWSAIQYAYSHNVMSSFLLNFGSSFDDFDAISYARPGRTMSTGPAWLNDHFKMNFRRLGLKRLRELANLEPSNSWSPLCMLAATGSILAVTNILQLGADYDFEGSPYGSALMVACSSGRLESVKILVRHGTTISYMGADGPRSAFAMARDYNAILAWLLVGRFTEQRKISYPADATPSPYTADITNARGGIVKAELVITGTAERQIHESAGDYWIRLMAVKREWRGRVVRQHGMVQTQRLSRLIPDEPVRICPGYYGVPEESR